MKKLKLLITALITGGCALLLWHNTANNPGKQLEINNVNIPAKLAAPAKEGIAPGRCMDGRVVDVSDGDTLKVACDGKTYKVRLIGVDTPESVKEGVPVQPYAREAARLTGKLALKRQVRLVFEKGVKDRYGRLLAHVFLPDNLYLNALLVRNGYARVETVKPNTTYSGYFYELQQQAIEAKAGFWALPEHKQPFVMNNAGSYVPRYLNGKKAS